ncbi:3-isopropylmalate dehydrogenase [Candidatus Tremblaya phenacola PAVE]|nr:3-isopropylmalate dehydrogenase [Candidatus Tremblaya phenacola PAVE]
MIVTVLPGDGIGPEVVREALRVLEALNICDLHVQKAEVGRTAHKKLGELLPIKTIRAVQSSDAVLLGAVGNNAVTEADDLKPERALLGLRKLLNCFVNLRPIRHHKSIIRNFNHPKDNDTSFDILIVRELNSGIYFGMPRGIRRFHFERNCSLVEGFCTSRYSSLEVETITRLAFEIAMKRKKALLLVDKANVLETSMVWRKITSQISKDYPNVRLLASYVDSASLQIFRSPNNFDVVLTDNLFGDILSDHLGLLAGSIGLLPSASLGLSNIGLYEPVHGSAPSLVGKDVANPIAAIMSLALMLRHSFGLERDASAVEVAVSGALRRGYRTADMIESGNFSSTSVVGEVVAYLIRIQNKTN